MTNLITEDFVKTIKKEHTKNNIFRRPLYIEFEGFSKSVNLTVRQFYFMHGWFIECNDHILTPEQHDELMAFIPDYEV